MHPCENPVQTTWSAAGSDDGPRIPAPEALAGEYIPKPDEPEPNRGYDGSLMDDRESDHGYGDA